MSNLNISILIDKNLVERYRAVSETQRIHLNSFEFKIEAIDETKVNMINLLFDTISNSDLNLVCFKFLTMKGWAVKEVIYGCIMGLDGRMPGCKLPIHVDCF